MNEFLNILTKLSNDYFEGSDSLVCKPFRPEYLQVQIDFELHDNGCSLDVLQDHLGKYINLSPNVSKVGFHKQLYSGVSKPALLGEWVASLTNAVMHTYKMGPVATLMELEIVSKLNEMVGFTNGDGIMVSGASQANLIAMMTARHKFFPDIRTNGFQGKTLVAFVSEQAHYSMQRAANVLGLGENNLVAVKSDAQGCMDPNDLKVKIMQTLDEGKQPFFVGLTAGTTVIGAYDPVSLCGQVAKEFNLWLHIDGAWGAPILFSKTHRSVLNGSENADSFTWDAHKLMNVPLTAGIILIKDKGMLKSSISGGGGNYLFHKDEDADYNLGEMSIQSARRADCLKLWSAWKFIGSNGYEQKINNLINYKNMFIELLKEEKLFEAIAPSPFLNILFQYKPSDDISESSLKKINIEICKRLASEGIAFIDYATFKGRTGIRLILANESISKDYLSKLIQQCKKIGDSISPSILKEKIENKVA